MYFTDGFTATSRATGNWNVDCDLVDHPDRNYSTVERSRPDRGPVWRTNFLNELSARDVITLTADGR